MIKKLFKGIFTASVLTFIACFALILSILYNYFDNQLHEKVREEGIIIAGGMTYGGEDYLKNLEKSELRITWINTEGRVLFDNKEDISVMENHANRIEVRDAMQKSRGEALRYSATMSSKTFYFAIRLDDSSVLRVSAVQYTVWNLLYGMMQPFLIVLVIAIALSAFLASRISRSIIKPINSIDIENPDFDKNYDEISPLLIKIKRQNEQIHNQIKELGRKQEEFKLITENMSEGFLVIDSKTELLSYNTAAVRLFGANPEKISGSVFTLNRSEVFRLAVETALRGEHNEQTMSFGESYYHIIANPVLNGAEVTGAVIIILDYTERELRDQLRREFTSNVSHELKTPLTSIYGVSEILMNGIVKADDIPIFTKNIHDESGRLITLINDIIRLSQLDENSIPQPKEKVDLYETARMVIERLTSNAEARGITISLSGESAVIDGVPAMIREIVYNLCDNAIKYNKDGGSVTVNVEAGDGYHCIKVKDTGIGIPREYHERVFERFFRADKSHSKKIGGTGLGLSIVKHAAAYHGAAVNIKSVVDSGTEIIVTFKV